MEGDCSDTVDISEKEKSAPKADSEEKKVPDTVTATSTSQSPTRAVMSRDGMSLVESQVGNSSEDSQECVNDEPEKTETSSSGGKSQKFDGSVKSAASSASGHDGQITSEFEKPVASVTGIKAALESSKKHEVKLVNASPAEVIVDAIQASPLTEAVPAFAESSNESLPQEEIEAKDAATAAAPTEKEETEQVDNKPVSSRRSSRRAAVQASAVPFPSSIKLDECLEAAESDTTTTTDESETTSPESSPEITAKHGKKVRGGSTSPGAAANKQALDNFTADTLTQTRSLRKQNPTPVLRRKLSKSSLPYGVVNLRLTSRIRSVN